MLGGVIWKPSFLEGVSRFQEGPIYTSPQPSDQGCEEEAIVFINIGDKVLCQVGHTNVKAMWTGKVQGRGGTHLPPAIL